VSAETLCVSGIYSSNIKQRDSRGHCLTKTEFLHSVPLSLKIESPNTVKLDVHPHHMLIQR